MKSMFLIGSNSIHLKNYKELIGSEVESIHIISNVSTNDFQVDYALDFGLSIKSLIITPLKIRRLINKIRPEVIHIHQANSYAFYTILASLFLSVPCVLTCWGSDILLLPKKNSFFNWMTKFIVNRVDYITADAHFVGKEVAQYLHKPTPILIANFGIIQNTLQIPKEKIIYSNRLHKPLYRIDKLLKAFQLFVKKHADWRLVVAATGEETEKLKAFVQKEQISNVEFVGWVDREVNFSYYARSTYWISIPESDATAISLLEAMDGGCIPIVSDLPANKEWIKHLENGCIVTDLEEDFISKALSIEIPKAQRINEELVQLHATKETNRNKFLTLYSTLLLHA